MGFWQRAFFETEAEKRESKLLNTRLAGSIESSFSLLFVQSLETFRNRNQIDSCVHEQKFIPSEELAK